MCVGGGAEDRTQEGDVQPVSTGGVAGLSGDLLALRVHSVSFVVPGLPSTAGTYPGLCPHENLWEVLGCPCALLDPCLGNCFSPVVTVSMCKGIRLEGLCKGTTPVAAKLESCLASPQLPTRRPHT